MNRIGEVNANSKGQRFAISDYRSCNDMDIIFENNRKKTVTYPQFKSGHISMPGQDNASDWVGEIIEDRNGEECTIVSYDSEDNITVQYEDGDIVAGLSENDIVSAAFDRDRNNADFLAMAEYRDRGNIELERKMTYDNVVYMLNRFKRCVMIRPCSFGKTKIGLKLFSSPRYKRCLFLHPQDDDVNATIIQKSQSKKHIDTKTYAWLRSRTEQKIKSLNYDIVFCDEIHGVAGTDDGDGAAKTYAALKLFMESHPDTHFVGATATPARMDGLFPVVSTMFHNHTCYPYTDEDAFEDGLLKSPYYYYGIHDVEKIVRKEIEKTVHVEMGRDELQKRLKFSEEEIQEIDTKYMDQHIAETCSSVLPSTKYMRFIVFYPTNDEILENRQLVTGWFKKAYPNHEVCSIVVTNRTRKSLQDVDNLPTEASDPKYEGRIDLVFNCEKLCMGYHSEHITGLVIDRKTKSLTKYLQMMGRLLSCDNDNPVVIFDIADNIHADFVCKAPQEEVAPVKPVFTKKPTTFAEILAAYPHARHWNEIKKNNKKAKKSEEMIVAHAIAEGEINEDNMQMFDVAPAASYARCTGQIGLGVKRAEDLAKQEHISFADACDRIAGVKNAPVSHIAVPGARTIPAHPYAHVNAILADRKQKSPAANHPEELRTGSSYDADTANIDIIETQDPNVEEPGCVQAENIKCSSSDPQERPISIEGEYSSEAPQEYSSSKEGEYSSSNLQEQPTSQEEPEEEEYLGYYSSHVYDPATRDLYSRRVKLLNKQTDFEQEIKKIIANINKQMFENILKKWHTYPSCENNYTDYSEIQKNNAKFKFLKSCSEYIYGVPVEKTLLYMIEGKIA